MVKTIIFDAKFLLNLPQEDKTKILDILKSEKFFNIKKILAVQTENDELIQITPNDMPEIDLSEKININHYYKLEFKKIAKILNESAHKILFVSNNKKYIQTAKRAFFQALLFKNTTEFIKNLEKYTEPTLGDLYQQRSPKNKLLLHIHTLVFLITPAFFLMVPSSPIYYDSQDPLVAQIMSYAGLMFILFLYYFYFFNISYLPKENKKVFQYFFLPTIVNTCGVVLLRGFSSLKEIVILDGTILIGATVLTMIALFFTDKKNDFHPHNYLTLQDKVIGHLFLILLPLSVILLYTSYIGQIFSPMSEIHNAIGVAYTVISTLVLAKIQFQHTYKISISH